MVTPWIKNASLWDVVAGDHPYDDNTILIRILNPGFEFPETKHTFKDVHCFEMLDIDDDEFNICCTDLQAEQVAAILVKALADGQNVLVHCHVGVSRSGAVVDAGLALGFRELPRTFRTPNIHIKKRLFRALYDELSNKNSTSDAGDHQAFEGEGVSAESGTNS